VVSFVEASLFSSSAAMWIVLYFVVRVRCRRKKSSRSLSHLVMSFLYYS